MIWPVQSGACKGPAIVNHGELIVEDSVIADAEDGVLNYGDLHVLKCIIRDIARDGIVSNTKSVLANSTLSSIGQSPLTCDLAFLHLVDTVVEPSLWEEAQDRGLS